MQIKDNPYTKIMRAEKTTPNVDDTKVVLVGFVAFLFLLIVQHYIFPDLIVLDISSEEVITQEDN